MSASLGYVTLRCCVFLAFLQAITGLTCYSCTACGKNRDSWSTASSSANGAMCSKYVYHVGAVSYVNRDVRSPCTPGSDGVSGTYYCCSTDTCNGGVSFSNSLGLAFVLVAAVIVLKTIMLS